MYSRRICFVWGEIVSVHVVAFGLMVGSCLLLMVLAETVGGPVAVADQSHLLDRITPV